MRNVVLVTAAEMPKPDNESHLLIDALVARGVTASVVPWTSSIDWAAADLVVIRTTWDYFRRLDEFLRWAEDVEAVTRLVNPVEVLRWNAHKSYLLDLEARGVPAVATLLVPQWATLVDDARFAGWGEVVVKPAVSIGAIGASRRRTDDPDLPGLIAQLAVDGDVLVQPFVSSVEASGETSLVFAGGAFSHAVRKVPAPGDYRVQDHHGGTVEHHDPTPEEVAVAEAALAAAPAPCAYARVDLVASDTRPMVMELELIEPALFLTEHPAAADTVAHALLEAIG